MEEADFSDKRYAILLKKGSYAGKSAIPIGYVTTLAGVGDGPDDVIIDSFYSHDNPKYGNACNNFWRSVEGVSATNPSCMWAASQAAPLRRVHVQGDLWLSMQGAPHWSSGGLLADSVVDGVLQFGTQQQYLVRNVDLNGGAAGRNKNYVFLGTKGAPASQNDGTISTVDATPRGAVKPYLHEDDGTWSILVPPVEENVVGFNNPTRAKRIDMADVFVAREGDTAATINSGIASKKALLLTPAFYGLEKAISITKSDFVVLGIGFATLVPYNGNAAIDVAKNAHRVYICGLLLEPGTPVTHPSPTQPLLLWSGDHGVAADIFSRVGAFSYSRPYKASCLTTKANTHMEIRGSGTTIENIWAWHADHDDCNTASDRCQSDHGLVVRGDDVVVYGLKAEHTFDNIVQWYGEKGQVYLFQSELPYHVASYPSSGAYMVNNSVREHKGVGLGVYQIGTYTVDTGLRVPPTADITNAFIWCITGPHTRFRSVICTSASGMSGCSTGDRCDGNSCYKYHTGSGASAFVLTV
jgi:hypothetical protein